MPPRMSEVARRLFEHRGRDGAGALHLASALGDDAAIAAMLRAGAKVDGIDSRGCSPLHWAAAYGREEALALLLAAGADPGQVIDEAAGTSLLKTSGLRRLASPFLNASAFVGRPVARSC